MVLSKLQLPFLINQTGSTFLFLFDVDEESGDREGERLFIDDVTKADDDDDVTGCNVEDAVDDFLKRDW